VDLSIVIPAHNEADRILPYLQEITLYMRGHGRTCQIIVVDDGSTDETAAAVTNFLESNPEVQLIRKPLCTGKGSAVRRGMQAAIGQLQLFTDADGATPIAELARLEQAITNGADLAIGSRALASRMPDFRVRARMHRSIFGTMFNSIVRQCGIRGIADTQCGFKLFPRKVARDLFSVSSIDGYGFDLELLYVARQRGYRIAEVPINWTDQPGSKVRLVRDGFVMLRDLAVVRRNAIHGRYNVQPLQSGFKSAPLEQLDLPPHS
jgi:dolichyl-phosphate beta-glucosyltransferase